MQPSTAKWYDRWDSVFIEFCVEDSKDVNMKFDEANLLFSCIGGEEDMIYFNEVELFKAINPNKSKHKRTDRSVCCCLRKAEAGKLWPRLTKDKAKFNWLSVDFNNFKDWEEDFDEEYNYDLFSEMNDTDDDDDDQTGTDYDDDQTGTDGEDDRTGTDGEDDRTGTDGEDDRTGIDGEDDRTGIDGEDDRTGMDGEDDRTGIDAKDDEEGADSSNNQMMPDVE